MNFGRIEAQGTYADLKNTGNYSLLWLGIEEEQKEPEADIIIDVSGGVYTDFI